jgi:hypothetical protein
VSAVTNTLEGTREEWRCGVESDVRLRQRGTVWHVRAAWQRDLLGAGGPDWFALETDPRSEAVKAGDGRMTWRVALPRGVVYAKVVDAIGWTRRWRCRLSAGAAQREWRLARMTETRGIPAVRCVGLGVRGGHTPRTVILSEGLTGAVELSVAWAQCAGLCLPAQCHRSVSGLIEGVARLFAVAHERGFVHGDAHPGNILVRTGDIAGAKAEAFFVDVHEARLLRGPVPPRAAAASLAQLDRYFHRLASRTRRLRFLKAYLAGRPSMERFLEDPNAQRRFLSSVVAARVKGARHLARHWDRRLRRTGKYFATFDLGAGWRARAVLELERRHVFPEPEVRDRTMEQWRLLLRRVIERLPEMEGGGRPFEHEGLVVEVDRVGSLPGRLFASMLRTEQLREFNVSHQLRHRDSAGDLVLAYAEHRTGGLVDVTFLMRAEAPRSPSDP